MLAPQSIDPLDSVLVFSGSDVITSLGEGVTDPTDPNYGKYQTEIGRERGESSISALLSLYSVTDGALIVSNSSVVMTFIPEVNQWTVLIQPLNLQDYIGHKVIGYIRNGSHSMKELEIKEFTVDDKMLEKTLATMGYTIQIDGSGSYFIWDDGNPDTYTYRAEAYKGGTGTTPATNVAEVTHRGPIEKV